MTLLTTSHEVKNLCNKLQNEAFICIDTEFIREKYYYPKLCLIQIGDSKGNGWAIDPLSKKINLDPLYNLLINEKILKVLHSPRQDFEIIFNILKKIPKPIFDTQSAAMTCGYGDSASYELLVNKIVNVKIDKSARFTNWENRPLNEKQIKYAISDVGVLASDPCVLTGSHNWSSNAENNSDENTLIIYDHAIANIYLQEFTERFNELATSTIDESIELELTLFPNPSKGFIQISSESEIKYIKLYSTDGSFIKTIYSPIVNINTSGIYFLKVVTKHGSVIRKVVIN